MAVSISLMSLFESNNDQLQAKLDGLTLPKDSQKIQAVVTEYLDSLFDSDGDFRQNLTQSEDYILQAALSLLNAQKEINKSLITEIPKARPITNSQDNEAEPLPNQTQAHDWNSKTKYLLRSEIRSSDALVGVSSGAIIGKAVLGGWGAVFGAIAGTAIMIYLSNRGSSNGNLFNGPQTSVPSILLSNDVPIDVNQFMSITANICSSVDNLIASFRAQINRVVDKYERQEKPTIEKQYKVLLEGIQSLVGYERTHQDDEKYVKKVQGRIEDLAELLENYGLTVIDYSEDKDQWFDKVSSPNTLKIKMVYPAIVKAERLLVLKGKVFVPEA